MSSDESKTQMYDWWGLGPSDGPQGDWVRYRGIIEYLHFQEEKGEAAGTHHLQGFIILKERKKLNWMVKHICPGAHFEVARGTDIEADEYTRKEETRVPGGMEFTFGERPVAPVCPNPKGIREMACQWLEKIKNEGFIPPKDIPACVLCNPGFLAAYKLLTASCAGPYRPGLKILTLIGPQGSGKSHAVQKYFPDAGRWLDGNGGNWFLNPMAKTIVFEEFDGSKIGIQAMKKFLDPYPYAFEVKGYQYPVLATRIIITSNVPPCLWYRDLSGVRDIGSAADKRALNINAIYDRIGYSSGGFIPSRTCGTYVEAPVGVPSPQLWDFFDKAVKDWLDPPAAAAVPVRRCPSVDLAAAVRAAQDEEDFGSLVEHDDDE